MGKYILEDHNPVPCEDVIEWGKWFEKADRNVVQTFIGIPTWKYYFGKLLGIKRWEPVTISTVFLGIDHHLGEGDPLLFETMVFDGKFDGEQWRYSTWDNAVEGHKKAIELVKGELNGKKNG